VTGGFQLDATFGLGEAKQTTLNAAFRETFVAKYDRHGAFVWARQIKLALFDFLISL